MQELELKLVASQLNSTKMEDAIAHLVIKRFPSVQDASPKYFNVSVQKCFTSLDGTVLDVNKDINPTRVEHVA